MVKYLKGDFQFPTSFGFVGSARGRDDARSHPKIKTDPYGHEPPDPNVRAPVNAQKTAPIQRLAVGGPAVAPPPGPPPAPGGALGALSSQPPQGGAEPTITMPMSTAANVAKHLVQTGAMHGAAAGAQAVARHAARRAPQPMAAPAPTPPMAPEGGMAEGGKFIAKAISRPGRETRRAKASGRSVHEQMEHDSHSSDPSLRSAANLGLRLTKGDLSPHRKRKT